VSTETGRTPMTAVMQALDAQGFAQVDAPTMRAMTEPAGLADWAGFAASWDDLGLDRFMADGGRYRRRRFAAFAVGSGVIRRKAHQPHYQSRDYNALNGGIARWFEPVADAIGSHPAATAILTVCDALFTGLTPPDLRPERWHVEMHQFRIEARPDVEGQPTRPISPTSSAPWCRASPSPNLWMPRWSMTAASSTGSPPSARSTRHEPRSGMSSS
jgi:hypothetical protein